MELTKDAYQLERSDEELSTSDTKHSDGQDEMRIRRKELIDKIVRINEMPEEQALEQFEVLTASLMNSDADLKPNWINFMISISVGFEAVPVGCCLVVGPLFIQTKFLALDTTIIGALYGGGTSAAAVLCMLHTYCRRKMKFTNRFERFNIYSPYNIIAFIIMIGLTALVICYASSPFILGLAIINLFFWNDLATIKLNKL
jgi:hypothetical protein